MTTLPTTLYALADGAIGELASDVNNSQATWTLKAGMGAKFPASDFPVRCESETAVCTGRSGDVLTLTRDGSAASHVASTVVHLAVSKALLQRVYDCLAGHHHNGEYEAAGAVAAHAGAADPHTGYQRESEKAQANGYASLGADGKVPSGQLPPSGSDPWTYVALSSDFSTTSATAVDITGLSFTPAANTRYLFEVTLLTRTATATVGPRPGVAWPTGMSDGVVSVQQTSSATANVFANGNIAGAVLAPVGGLPTTNGSWPAFVWGVVSAGASPSGTLRIQLASETSGTQVTAKAGSYLRYRTY